jgi:hypothetical protein
MTKQSSAWIEDSPAANEKTPQNEANNLNATLHFRAPLLIMMRARTK